MAQHERPQQLVSFDRSTLAEHCRNTPFSPVPEIIALIIEHADPRTLKMFSLTCRRWCPVARVYLFRTIRIRSSVYCKGFIRFLLSGSRRMPLRLTFLRDVRELVLQDFPFHNVDMTCAVQAFQMLSSVRKITLAFWRVGGLPSILVDEMQNCFPKLTSLKLYECDVADPYTFVQLVCTFPKLAGILVEDPKLVNQDRRSGAYDDLTLGAMGAMKHILDPRAVNEWTSLRTLVIRKLDLLPSKHCLRLAVLLLQPRFELDLRYLRINWNCQHLSPLLQLLDKIAQGPDRLEELVFAMEELNGETLRSQLRARIKAIPVNYVRSLTIGKINLYPGMDKSSLRWVQMLLSHIFGLQTWVWSSAPKHLFEIRFHLRFEGELDALEVFDWERFELETNFGRQRSCVGRDLTVRFQIWVQEHHRWVNASGAEELGKFLKKKVRGTGCGIRCVRCHMPAGEEEGSVEFEMTKWDGAPLTRTETWEPRDYYNW